MSQYTLFHVPPCSAHTAYMQYTFWHASGETFLPIFEVVGIATTSAIRKELTFLGLSIIEPPLKASSTSPNHRGQSAGVL